MPSSTVVGSGSDGRTAGEDASDPIKVMWALGSEKATRAFMIDTAPGLIVHAKLWSFSSADFCVND